MQNKPRKSCTRPAENKSLFPIPSTHPSNHPPFSTIPDYCINFPTIIATILPTNILRYFYDKQGDDAVAPIESLSLSTFFHFANNSMQIRRSHSLLFFLSQQYFLTTFDPAAISGKNIRYYTASEINYDPSLQSRHVSLQGNHAR